LNYLIISFQLMSKKISIIKKFNKLVLSVNERIESFFNDLIILASSKKKIKDYLRNIDKKITISIASVVILILSYFLIPTFYDKDLVKKKLTNQILKKFNLEVKFEGALEYGLLPKPHFFIKDTIIVYDEVNLAKTDFTKVYITANNFFSLENLEIKNLFFKKTEFNINNENYVFFKKILNSNKSNHYIDFKNSKLFYKDQNEDVIFLTNIKNLNFLYNDEFNQELNANLEIFNLPLKIKIINNLNKKNSFLDIDLHKLRVNIQNNFDYSKKKIIGLLDLKIINKLKKFNYSISKNSLNFNTEENNFKGKLDFKPFYLSSDIKFHQLEITRIFKSNSIFLDLLNADILNNQSLNAVINIKFDKVKDVNYLKNIVLKTYFEEGNIIIKDSTLNWKNSVLINLENVQLISENNKIIFVGAINFEFKNINDFYRQYQVKKIHRKKIQKIKLDFMLNLYENEIQLDNVKIDDKTIDRVNNHVNDFNSKKLNIFNKVIFKNSIKEFFGNI
jgi:hypothetical protein